MALIIIGNIREVTKKLNALKGEYETLDAYFKACDSEEYAIKRLKEREDA